MIASALADIGSDAVVVEALVIVFGLLMGSFANVLIHRLPRDQSPWRGRSMCPHCQRPVRWYENVPVLSWLLLRARCAGCGGAISWRYPLVELLSAAAAWICLRVFGAEPAAAAYYVFVMTLLTIAWIDWEHMIIPDELSLGVLVLGALLSLGVLPLGPVQALLGIVAGAGFIQLVAVLYRKTRGVEGMGFGDVKMAGMIGAFLGPVSVLLTIFVAAFLGSLFGALLLSRGGNRQSMVAFGTFLAASAVLVLFFGDDATHWYLGLMRR